MAGHGTWSRPRCPLLQGHTPIFFPPRAPPPPPPTTPVMLQPVCAAGPKPAPCYKHHAKRCSKSKVAFGTFEIPNSNWRSGGALCLSVLSVLAFTCALIFHGVMLYYAIESPTWVVMCWPFLLIPPVICNCLYLTLKTREVFPSPNTGTLCLYVTLSIAYLAWASYLVALTYKEGKCDQVSYSSLVVSILGLATVACALEWWLTIVRVVRNTTSKWSVTMGVYKKSLTKKKLVLTFRKNGKVFRQHLFNLEKTAMNCTGPCVSGSIAVYNKPAHCCNGKAKYCLMKHPGQCSPGAPPFNNTAYHYENEKNKEDNLNKYNKQCSANGAPFIRDAEQYEYKKRNDNCTEDSETDDLSFNNNAGRINNIA